jgi:hypothetical protein
LAVNSIVIFLAIVRYPFVVSGLLPLVKG